MMRKPLVALVTGSLLVVSAFAGTAVNSQKTVSVGDFAAKVAVALGYEAKDQTKAANLLRGRGIDLSADLSAPLTNGQVARMIEDLGIAHVKSGDSNALVTPAQAGSYVAAIGIQSANLGLFLTEVDNPPNQCLSSVDRGTCVNCCKDATGLTGKYCGRFCHSNVPPPISPEEPMP